jgi:RNA-directed DNA polymerase
MSTQLMGKKNLQTKLDRVEMRARQDKKSVFNNLGHVIDLELLRQCYHNLDGNKAKGIDGIGKEDYGTDLDENLKRLLIRVRRGNYHPKASRIKEIPKTDGTRRPLAIACFEDKLMQEAVRRVLERIYEPIFLNCSCGFRPGRNAHIALAMLNNQIQDWARCGAVLDMDLRKYFNTIPHNQLAELLREKVKDERFMRLIIKLLKAPVLTNEGKAVTNETGSPQGSILSPLLANIYLHYVLDEWFENVVRPRIQGNGQMVRYADDVVFTFKDIETTKRIKDVIIKRLNKYGLSINEDKTRIIICDGYFANYKLKAGKMPSFTFLGFRHVWGKAWDKRMGKKFMRIKRITCPIRYRKKLKEISTYIKQNRHDRDLVIKVKRITQGYINYFAVSDNAKRISQFIYTVSKILFKWLNRRSQRRSYIWDEFAQLLERIEFPKTKALINIHQISKALKEQPAVVCR